MKNNSYNLYHFTKRKGYWKYDFGGYRKCVLQALYKLNTSKIER